MGENKTNAMRILDKANIPYAIMTYDNEDGKIHGSAVAVKIGKPVEIVYKTLVAHQAANLFIFIIPVADELDLKRAAQAAGVKKLEMLPVKELQKWTGYIRGGCSPIGMKKLYPTYIDSKAKDLKTMIVSAGKIGLQLELEPHLLSAQVSAEFTMLVKVADEEISEVEEHRCPLCHEENQCRVESGDCWCFYTKIPMELQDRVSEELRGKICICQKCIEQLKSQKIRD